MPDHLKYDTGTGHLLHNDAGHLVWRCYDSTPLDARLPRIALFEGAPAIVFLGLGGGEGQTGDGRSSFIIIANMDSGGAFVDWGTPYEVFHIFANGHDFGSSHGDNSIITMTGIDSTLTIPNNPLVSTIYYNGVLDVYSHEQNYGDAATPTDFTGNLVFTTTNPASYSQTNNLLSPDGYPMYFQDNDIVSTAGKREVYAWIADDLDGEGSYTKYLIWSDTIPVAIYNINRTAVIDGNPAVFSFVLGRYCRASNTAGSAWNTSYNATLENFFDMKEVNSLAGVIGNKQDPAHTAYWPVSFQLSTNANGSAWDTPVIIPTYDADTDIRLNGGYGDVSTACIYSDGTTLTAYWALPDFIPVYDTTPVCMTFWYYSYCYYPILSYNLVVFKSTSTDNGATWTTPTQEWVHNVDSDVGQQIQYLHCIDADNVVYDYYDGTDYTIWYNGVQVVL